MPLRTALDLARLWYSGLLAPGWRRRTASEARAVFVTLELTSEAWLG